MKCIRALLALCLGVSLTLANAAEADLGPTLKRIADTGTVYLGYSEAGVPFSYLSEDKVTPVGYSIDICRQIVKAVETKLGKSVNVVPVLLPPNTRFLMVKTRMADIECGGSTHTVAREKLVDFSDTFFVSEVKVMVRADAGIHSLNDLAGKRVLTTSATTAERLIKMAALQRNMAITLIVGRNHAEAMAIMESGGADAYVADDAILAGRRAGAAHPEAYALLPESLSVEPYGLSINRDDPQFKQLVDETLVGMMRSGAMATLYAKWFTQPIPPRGINLELPMSPLNKASFDFPNDRPVN